ncbi:hypothetical protein J6590_039554 [Homalodisca vitripennis]|nr:hypothetical protein J6590_039554 [Homalodisca vitripennis]
MAVSRYQLPLAQVALPRTRLLAGLLFVGHGRVSVADTSRSGRITTHTTNCWFVVRGMSRVMAVSRYQLPLAQVALPLTRLIVWLVIRGCSGPWPCLVISYLSLRSHYHAHD